MTDRYNAVTVVLEQDMREDDAESLINAIRHLRGVISVTGNVTEVADHIAQSRARRELEQRLWEALHE